MTTPLSQTVHTHAAQTLGALAHMCRKAAAHAAKHGIDEANFLGHRMAPDMFAMARQVQVATDMFRRGAARLTGAEPDAMADTEDSFAALEARCSASLAAIMALDTGAMDEAPDRVISIPLPNRTMEMTKRDFLHQFMVTNLIFHASMTYALLRMQGVPLGKLDFLAGGQMPS